MALALAWRYVTEAMGVIWCIGGAHCWVLRSINFQNFDQNIECSDID